MSVTPAIYPAFVEHSVLPYHLILASGSPRRQEFLRALGLAFPVAVADVDESPFPNETPVGLAERLAAAKARAVSAQLPDDGARRLIIAADTVVALGDLLLGKPADDAEATAMLALLCGRTHTVYTAVSVLDTATAEQQTRVHTTQVAMRGYTDAELAAYVATGDPLDKAGAYAIQHPDFAPVAGLTGCAAGVIGLPLGDLRDLLHHFGVTLSQPVAAICQQHTAFPCCQLPAS